jgi:hypothetical protein
MTTIKHLATAFLLAACAATVPATDARAANTAEKTALTAPTKAALVTLETRAYAAWKSHNANFWKTFLSDNFVGYGASGKLNKTSATTEYTAASCEIKSYAVSEDHMTPIGNNAALLTYKGTVDGTCDGRPLPTESREASVYVREDNTWKNIFHAESPIVDPKTFSAKSADTQPAPKQNSANPAAPDPTTYALLAVEISVWEAWKDHDAKKIATLTASNISFINIFGTFLATKPDALKNWSGTGCDVKTVNVTDPVATMLSPTAGILTFNATADGTCCGQKVDPIHGTSIYVKEGNTWKWTFGINTPARP